MNVLVFAWSKILSVDASSRRDLVDQGCHGFFIDYLHDALRVARDTIAASAQSSVPFMSLPPAASSVPAAAGATAGSRRSSGACLCVRVYEPESSVWWLCVAVCGCV